MKWETTKEFYKKCWNVTMRLENNTVDYEGFLSCILNDFRMVDIKRSRVSTEEDFIRFVYTHFPLDSKAMKWAKKVIALKYYLKDKNEYIACFHRNMMAMQAKIVFRPRAEVEYNPEYIQLVAMAIPYFYTNDGYPVFLFVKEDASDMHGHTTMIGGHAQYQYNPSDAFQVADTLQSLESLCVDTARREAIEELGLRKTDIKYSTGYPTSPSSMKKKSSFGGIEFNTTTSVGMDSISYYHLGIGYAYEMKKESVAKATLEEGKSLVLFTPNRNAISPLDIKDKYHKPFNVITPNNMSEIVNPDPWLASFINSII